MGRICFTVIQEVGEVNRCSNKNNIDYELIITEAK